MQFNIGQLFVNTDFIEIVKILEDLISVNENNTVVNIPVNTLDDDEQLDFLEHYLHTIDKQDREDEDISRSALQGLGFSSCAYTIIINNSNLIAQACVGAMDDDTLETYSDERFYDVQLEEYEKKWLSENLIMKVLC